METPTNMQHQQQPTAALYARVSSDRQKEEGTIESQVEALLSEARQRHWLIPEEWIFRDEGYSGANLERPGLDILRDLATEGEVATVLVYAPDRLARKYALQVFLLEEFSRNGTSVEFVRSVKGETPEEQLLLQFQGMIAEYERSMIVERSRRGKRHKARQGKVNVLSGAPYGFDYHKVGEHGDARYEINAQQAAVVKQVYAWYTENGESMAGIVRKLNASDVPTRSGNTRWESTTVWGMLKNPAYKGKACFGKTRTTSQRIKRTKKLRERGGPSPRARHHEDVPEDQWIEINVPAIIDEATFDWARQRLKENRQRSRRRTKEPSILQSLLVCKECGYALYRTSTKTSAGKKIGYYRCIGSDNYRFEEGRVCESKPIRVDMLDNLVWSHLIELLRTPKLVEDEIERRKQASRESKLSMQRQNALQDEIRRLEKQLNRLLDAYQEDLLSLDELRQRTTPLNKRLGTVRKDLATAEAVAFDEGRFTMLAEQVNDFLGCLQIHEERLNIEQKQQIVRLLIKEVVVSGAIVTVHHSIPIPKKKLTRPIDCYSLCTRRHQPLVGEPVYALCLR
jgi:site-specific DNA recombinase